MIAPNPTTPAPRRQSLRALLNFFPRQQEALAAVERHTFTLYGGAAGGGKSRFLRWVAVILLIRWAKRGHKGVRVGLFSVDYPTLHDRQLSKIRAEFPDWLGSFNESAREFRLAPEYGGGVICFRNLDDPSKYKSAEFAAILVDELTESEQSVFDLLRFRLRWPGIDDTRFVGATNPGGVGHDWCKRLWIDRDFPPELADRAGEFAYVKATALDNPHNSPSYLKELQSLPDDLRRAFFEGCWDHFQGQVFSEFRREVHVVAAFAIPAHWRRWVGNDPGYSDPSCWYFFAADEQGTVHVYRELTFSRDRTPDDAPPSKQARAVMASRKWRDDKDREHTEEVDFFVTGHDAFAVDPETHKSIADYYREQGVGPLEQAAVKRGSRKARATILHEYLYPFPHPTIPGRRTARIQIHDCCRELIRTLPSLPADEHEPEAVADCAVDHWYDALSYGLQAWHARRSVLPPASARPGTMAHVLRHDLVHKPKPKGGSLLRRGG